MAGNNANTKALLQFDGTDGSTTITDDAAGASHAWTAAGDAQLDTADQQFGTASLLCDGTDDHVYAGDSADWQFGTGAFCCDLWAKMNSSETFGANRRGLLSYAGAYTWGSTGIEWMLVVGPSGYDAVRFEIYVGTGTPSRIVTCAETFSGWNHYCVCSDGTTIYLFINGILKDSAAFPGMTHPSSMATPRLRVGAVQDSGGGTYDWIGWIDAVRVQKGTSGIFDPFDPLFIPSGVASDGFTPPAAAYSESITYYNSYGFLALSGDDGGLTLTDNVLIASETGTLLLSGSGAAGLVLPSETGTLALSMSGGASAIRKIDDFIRIIALGSGSDEIIDISDAVVVYGVKLTGGASDLTLAASSISARHRNDAQSWLSVVVPNGGAYIDEITARSSGDLVFIVSYRDPLTLSERYAAPVFAVSFATVATSQGPTAYTLTLSGFADFSRTGKTWDIDALGAVTKQKRSDSEKIIYRVPVVNPWLGPGDVVPILTDTVEIVSASYQISADNQYIDIVGKAAS